MKRTIITISREYGSGGRLIGKKLAELLEIPFYDRELIALAAKKSGLREEIFEHADERTSGSFLYSIALGMCPSAIPLDNLDNMPLSDRAFFIQSDVIRDIAKQGSCVIVGRCADYILREDPDAVHVFIHAPIEARVERATTLYALEAHKARAAVQRMDKRRSAYHEYYAGERFGDADLYDLSFDSSKLDIDRCAQLIRLYVGLRAGE